jgi:hypothetical protein
MDSENTMIARHGLSELPLEVLQHVYACLSTLNDRIQLSRVSGSVLATAVLTLSDMRCSSSTL